MRKILLSILGLTAVSTAAFAGLSVGPAAAERLQIGNLIVTVDGSFKPKRLPVKKMAPIALKAEGHIRTDDGTTPPRADVVTVDFDRNGTLRTKGIKTCRQKALINTTPRTARRKCRKSIVGGGSTRAIVDFPDQEPFEARGPLTIFNGKPKGKGKRRKPTILFHTRANVPLPTTFVAVGVLRKSPLKGMGKRLVVRVPTIAGGNGTLVDFKANVNRKPATGKRYIVARCKNGRLKARGQVKWAKGTSPRSLEVSIVRQCKKKKQRRRR